MIRLGGLEWSRTVALEFWHDRYGLRDVVHLAQFDIENHGIDRLSGARELPRVASCAAAANDAG